MHVFVAMPFGIKEGINFDVVYSEFVKPALISDGLEVFRADEEIRAGEIRTDMFQELLLADIVIADLSINNPNVWYELGVRHALRARGVIQIKCNVTEHLPFDVYTDRTFTYHIRDGIPDREFVNEDKKRLVEMVRATTSSWHGQKISPVYHLLRFLREPDWKSLKVDQASEFWEKFDQWSSRIVLARKKQRPGDILVLADEAPIRPLRLESYKMASRALLELSQYSLALEQIERALQLDPQDLRSIQQKGILLGRLKKFDEAKEWMKAAVAKYENDAETWALLGRVEKDNWIASWLKDYSSSEEMKSEATSRVQLLREAIIPYLKGFEIDPSHYYSGINALTLMSLLQHLTQDSKMVRTFNDLEGGIRWSLKGAISKETPRSKDYWARVTLADLELLTHKKVAAVKEAYQSAAAAADRNWFMLDSSRQQIQLLKRLGFRPLFVDEAIKIFDQSLQDLEPSAVHSEPATPRLVFLFSGHMIDTPERTEPRFPNKEDYIIAAGKAISERIVALGGNESDLALCGGACGGDLLFAEACLKLGMRLEIRIPFDEPVFLQNSVTFAGEFWHDMFYRMKGHPKTKLFVMPEELGRTPEGINPYSRNNLWQVYTALAWSPVKVRFVCLWNRKEGDELGGTKHMYDQVQNHFGQVHVIDINKLFNI